MTPLTPRDRTRRALNREPVDRLPTQTNYTPAMGRILAEHFSVPLSELPDLLGNHLLRVDLRHTRKVSPDGRIAFDWWGAGWSTETEGYFHCFAPLASEPDLDRFCWPDPSAAGLLDEAAASISCDGRRHFAVPNLGMCLFERAWSLRGFEAFLMDMLDRPEWVEELLDRIARIQVTLVRRYIDAGVDGGYFGDDYGAQRSLLFSARLWRRFIKPRLACLFAPFREAGLPVILHSDGDIRAILPDLVEVGITTLNPVQPEVLDHGMLEREYGDKLSFYGGISTQSVLPHAVPDEIRAATVGCVKALAPAGTGLLLGPSHRMQTDIPVAAVEAMLGGFPK